MCIPADGSSECDGREIWHYSSHLAAARLSKVQRYNYTTCMNDTLHASLMEYLVYHLCVLIFFFLQTSQRVPDRFRQDALFGVGRGVSEAWWRALGRELISEKYLMEASGYNKFSTLCKLTPKVLLSEAQTV